MMRVLRLAHAAGERAYRTLAFMTKRNENHNNVLHIMNASYDTSIKLIFIPYEFGVWIEGFHESY